MYLYVGGWKEVSLVDVLESTSFTLWLSFCNFRCPWCSNSRIARGAGRRVEIDNIVNMVADASPFIDFFHVTGGEPILQFKPLSKLFRRISEETNLRLSFDTNASIPQALEYIFSKSSIDHVAIDVKAPLSDPELYARVIGLPAGIAYRVVPLIREGIRVASMNTSFLELRVTMVPGLIQVKDVERIAYDLKGVIKNKPERLVFVVQQFIPYEGVQGKFREVKPTSLNVLRRAARLFTKVNDIFEVWVRSIEEGAIRLDRIKE